MGAAQSTSTDAGNPKAAVEFDIACHVEVEEVVDIAECAGKAILAIYNSQDADVSYKGDGSPLTAADIASNSIICERLQQLNPHVPIISEENKIVPYSIRKKYQFCWMVDGLDGTKEFIKRNGQFTVMIALIQDQEPVLGVCHVPVTGATYYAVKGKGAYVRHKGDVTRITCQEFDLGDTGLTFVGSASHTDAVTKEFVGMFKAPVFKALGSSLKLTMVAEGEATVYPRFAPTCEWDTAAADIIVREAGGVVLQAGKLTSNGQHLEDWRDVLVKEQPLVYNKEDLLNPAFVVFGKRRSAAAAGEVAPASGGA